MISQLLKIIRESIKAVPAMKYALAVAGILAVVAMIGAFKLSAQMAVIGAVVTLVLMVAMVVFARLTTVAPRHFFLPVQVMMWAFLVITVGTALLLFTSAFFHWPRGLRELLDPKAATPVATRDVVDTSDVRNLISAAQQQRGLRDYAGAWTTIERAVALQPSSVDAATERLQVAMAWIRDMSVRDSETFADTLRPLTECLHVHATTAKGPLAADIQAHFGWANFLRWKQGEKQLLVEENYVAAVAHDATNPFAHAMWGHWLAVRGRTVREMNQHFDVALKSGRERPFVQNFRVSALIWAETPESMAELLRVADQMRRAGEALNSNLRSRICTEVYSRLGKKDESTLLAILPPGDHLVTFHWLLDGRNTDDNAELAYFRARLTEANGEFEPAAKYYRALIAQDTTMEERAKAGLARCERLTKSKG